MKEKVLVTGGSGFLGANLAKRLFELGFEVNILYRKGEKHPFFSDFEATHFQGDINDIDLVENATKGCSYVFHTVAYMAISKKLKPLIHKVNVGGTKTCLDAAKKAGVKRFIYTATVNTIGVPAKGQIGNENTPFNWEKYGYYYAITKKEAQELAFSYNSDSLEVVVVHPGTLFGAGDVNFNPGGKYVELIYKNILFIAPPGATNCVAINDVVEGHILALQKGKPGEGYILGGINYSYKELYELIAEVLGHKFHPIVELPKEVTIAGGWLNEKAFELLQKETDITTETARAGCLELRYTSDKAKKELGYKNTNFKKAIRETIDFYKKYNLI